MQLLLYLFPIMHNRDERVLEPAEGANNLASLMTNHETC